MLLNNIVPILLQKSPCMIFHSSRVMHNRKRRFAKLWKLKVDMSCVRLDQLIQKRLLFCFLRNTQKKKGKERKLVSVFVFGNEKKKKSFFFFKKNFFRFSYFGKVCISSSMKFPYLGSKMIKIVMCSVLFRKFCFLSFFLRKMKIYIFPLFFFGSRCSYLIRCLWEFTFLVENR